MSTEFKTHVTRLETVEAVQVTDDNFIDLLEENEGWCAWPWQREETVICINPEEDARTRRYAGVGMWIVKKGWYVRCMTDQNFNVRYVAVGD